MSEKAKRAVIKMLEDEIACIEKTVKNNMDKPAMYSDADFNSMWRAQANRMKKMRLILVEAA